MKRIKKRKEKEKNGWRRKIKKEEKGKKNILDKNSESKKTPEMPEK